MPRKPTATAQLKLRIREDLRRRLEAAAKKRAVSLNSELVWRLQQSLDRESLITLNEISEDMKNAWERYGNAFIDRDASGDQISATEELLKQIDLQDPRAIAAAVAEARRTIAVIEQITLARLRRKTSTT